MSSPPPADPAQHVSAVVGCRNRKSSLVQVIQTWLSQPRIHEIIVVDWGSTTPVSESLANVSDPRLRVVRVDGVERWLLSTALNFGISLAESDLVLKLDADTHLAPQFFAKHANAPNTNVFYSGDWRHARDENERHLNGVLYIAKATFLKVGGYNEFIRTYGYDDADLYARLVEAGTTRQPLDVTALRHIPHTDEERGTTDAELQISENMFLCSAEPWTVHKKRAEFRKLSANHYELVTLAPAASPSTLADCHHKALRERLAAAGYPWDWTQCKSLSFLESLYQRRHRKKLFIEPLNGLGNRLRAIASAGVLAETLERNLVVVWVPDEHLNSEYKDLFLDEEIVVVKSRESINLKVQLVGPNSGAAIAPGVLNLHSDADVYLASACVVSKAWAREAKWLRQNLHLVPDLAQRVASAATELDISKCIGMHIRMGLPAEAYAFEDSSNWTPQQRRTLMRSRARSHYSYFIEEMERIWSTNASQTFFVCADNPDAYTAMKRLYPPGTAKAKLLIYTPKTVFDRSAEQLRGAIVDVYLLAQTKYVLGSPWSSYSELVSRLGGGPVLIAGKDFGRRIRTAGLVYGHSLNLGDDIQTLAALRFCSNGEVDYWVDRDALDRPDAMLFDSAWKQIPALNVTDDEIRIVMNGWYDGRFLNWPPAVPALHPLLISMHINEDKELEKRPEYKSLFESNRDKDGHSMVERGEQIDYFRRHGPVGCRDQHTLEKLTAARVPAYHSACLTLTLRATVPRRTSNAIIVVDAHISFPRLYRERVPAHIRALAQFEMHGLREQLPHATKQEMAKCLLAKYQTAKLVITSRLHAALPSLAFGTPVYFIHEHIDTDPRFDSFFKQLLMVPEDWDWDQPRISPHQQRMIDRARAQLEPQVKAFFSSGNRW